MRTVSGIVAGCGCAFLLAACGPEKAVQGDPVRAARAATVPRNTLAELHWLTGTWRGAGTAGTVQTPFFERYSLASDSTLVVESFRDSTLADAPDSTRYDLRGDSLASDEAAASRVSPSSLTFSSRRNAGLAWTWRRDDDSTWTAIIVVTSPAGPPRTRMYRMVRLK